MHSRGPYVSVCKDNTMLVRYSTRTHLLTGSTAEYVQDNEIQQLIVKGVIYTF